MGKSIGIDYWSGSCTDCVFSSNTIEKSLKSIETQNNRVIDLLEEIRDKK